jgi:signal transduction histidine kinase
MSKSAERTRSEPEASGIPGRSPGRATPDESLERIAAAIPVGVALVRGERLVWINDRLAEMAGRSSPAALVGSGLAELFKDTGNGLPNPSRPRAVECGLPRPDGQLRRAICRLAWPEAGAAPAAWVVEDVTHVRVLETEILRLSRALHHANREEVSLRERLRAERSDREELLGVVSHELRTPLTVIRGYNRLLLAEEVGPLNPEQRRFLEECGKSCQRLNDFIGNLLESSREAASDPVLEVCHSSLVPLIEGAVDLLRPLLEEQGLTVEVVTDPELSPARVDRLRVEQILSNLIGNVIRHGGGGGVIEIAARDLPEQESAGPPGRRFVEISVSDDGPGIPPEDRERIFEPYVQAGEESRAGGLGLGLAICKRLVEAHGGTIGVSERPEGGSCFTFTLPTAGGGHPGGAAASER